MHDRLLLVAALATAAVLPARAQDIVIGQSVALSGPNADIGRDMRDGAAAVFARANAANTIGRKIQLVTLDDANSRQRAAENTQQLLGPAGAMVLFGYNSATSRPSTRSAPTRRWCCTTTTRSAT